MDIPMPFGRRVWTCLGVDSSMTLQHTLTVSRGGCIAILYCAVLALRPRQPLVQSQLGMCLIGWGPRGHSAVSFRLFCLCVAWPFSPWL
jgi:hypothetical protein